VFLTNTNPLVFLKLESYFSISLAQLIFSRIPLKSESEHTLIVKLFSNDPEGMRDDIGAKSRIQLIDSKW
jgi:hypothetical protein